MLAAVSPPPHICCSDRAGACDCPGVSIGTPGPAVRVHAHGPAVPAYDQRVRCALQVNIGTALLKANCSPSQAAMAAELVETLLNFVYGPDAARSTSQSALSRVVSTTSLSSMQGFLGDSGLATAVAAAAAADVEAESADSDHNRSWYSTIWDTLADDDP
jgi:hypothetical protein